MKEYSISTCFSPLWFSLFKNPEAHVVIIDVMRATTSICTAINNGAQGILPVGSVEEARELKNKGYTLAAERNAIILDFADFGNSPDEFTKDRVENKIIAYSTTNGTKAIKAAADCKNVLIGAFINLSNVSNFLIKNPADVILFCAGWKGRFSLEDSLCAGAIADKLLNNNNFKSDCDSTTASLDLWSIAKSDMHNYMKKASHQKRLKGLVSNEIINYCHSIDIVNVLPCLKNGLIVKY